MCTHTSNTLQIGLIFRVFSGEVTEVWCGKLLNESCTADCAEAGPLSPDRPFPQPESSVCLEAATLLVCLRACCGVFDVKVLSSLD